MVAPLFRLADAGELVMTKLPVRGMDRDRSRVMLGTIVHAALLSAMLACQQVERREASGEVAATLPVRPAPIPTPDADVRAAQEELADGRPARASRIVMPVLHDPARRTPEALPPAREWLLLRSAGATEDPNAREKLYAGVRGTAAKARVPFTEAQTLERFGKELAAADAYEKLGDMPSAYRLRLASAEDVALKSGTRAGLLG